MLTSSRYTTLKPLAGIHDAVWVESALELAHQLQFERRFIAPDFLALQLAQAVLGADRAAEASHTVVHDAVDRRRIPDKSIRGNPLGSGYVVVDVSVAEVSERHNAHAGISARELRVGLRNESGNARDGNRPVVLDVLALVRLRLGDKFTQLPESSGLCITLRDRRVENVVLQESPFEHAFDQSFWAFSRLRVREFHKDIVREAARKRCGGIPEMLEHEREAKIGEQLEARDPLTTGRQGPLEQCQGLFWTFQRHHGRRMRLRQRKEFQNRGCDYAERSFRTDEKLLQVIARVVLAQAAQAIPYLSRGQHDLEPQHELAR